MVGTTSDNIDAQIEAVGATGWYRCSVVGSITTTFVAMIFPAEADGGIIESIQCLSDAIYAFPQADKGRQLFDAYDARCEAASGDTEARVCTINELNDLL